MTMYTGGLLYIYWSEICLWWVGLHVNVWSLLVCPTLSSLFMCTEFCGQGAQFAALSVRLFSTRPSCGALMHMNSYEMMTLFLHVFITLQTHISLFGSTTSTANRVCTYYSNTYAKVHLNIAVNCRFVIRECSLIPSFLGSGSSREWKHHGNESSSERMVLGALLLRTFHFLCRTFAPGSTKSWEQKVLYSCKVHVTKVREFFLILCKRWVKFTRTLAWYHKLGHCLEIAISLLPLHSFGTVYQWLSAVQTVLAEFKWLLKSHVSYI